MDGNSVRVFYNSACPVCNAGITSQKDKLTICEIQWLDVHSDVQARENMPDELEAVRERLHAVDENGDLHIGIDAFLLIWRNTTSEKWKARLVGLPIVKPISIIAYNNFAKFLYAWNIKKRYWTAKLEGTK
jgi:predicted DCC family thiol-disulfide oxidoreductase YuxK